MVICKHMLQFVVEELFGSPGFTEDSGAILYLCNKKLQCKDLIHGEGCGI